MTGPRWHAAESGRFRFRQWPGEGSAGAFDRRSGATHCVSSLGMELLARLRAEPRNVADLAEALAAGRDGSPPACNLLQDELSRLQRIGLVIANDPAK